MILPDVNVLIYAFRSDSENHDLYRRWLQAVIDGPAAYGIVPQVLASVVRICTHPRIFVRPSARAELFHYCAALLGRPNATVIEPGERHWAIFQRLCEATKAGGNLVQDAWFAAVAIESGCEWITTDRDYTRFPGLSQRAPF